MNVKKIIIIKYYHQILSKIIQDKNAKETFVNLQHKVIILEAATYSVEQYEQRNNIEITGIPDNIGDKSLEHSVIEVFQPSDIHISHTDIEDCHLIGKSKDNSKKTIVTLVNRKYCKQVLCYGKKQTKIFVNEKLKQLQSPVSF